MSQTKESDIAAIVDWLREVQAAKGLSDDQMTRALRLSDAGWRHLRTGRRGLTLHTVYWAARAFQKEALPPMLSHLLGVGQVSQQDGDINAPLSA